MNLSGSEIVKHWMYRKENGTIIQFNPYALVHFHPRTIGKDLYLADADSAVLASLTYQFRLERHFEIT